MAWEWSHTDEALLNARGNLRKMPLDRLAICYAEWWVYFWSGCEEEKLKFNRRYKTKIIDVVRNRIGRDEAEDYIWTHAAERATCDNGGFNAWMCPWGCHTVTFDKE